MNFYKPKLNSSILRILGYENMGIFSEIFRKSPNFVPCKYLNMSCKVRNQDSWGSKIAKKCGRLLKHLSLKFFGHYPTSRNTQTGKDILGGNFILGGKTGKVEEIFAQLLKKFWNFLCFYTPARRAGFFYRNFSSVTTSLTNLVCSDLVFVSQTISFM